VVSRVSGLNKLTSYSKLDKAREYYLKNTELDPQNPTPFYAVGSVNWLVLQIKSQPKPPEEQGQLVDEGLQNLDKAMEGLEDQGPLSVLGIAVNNLF